MNKSKSLSEHWNQLNLKFLVVGFSTLILLVYAVLEFGILEILIRFKVFLVLGILSSFIIWFLSWRKISIVKRNELGWLHAIGFGITNALLSLSLISIYLLLSGGA